MRRCQLTPEIADLISDLSREGQSLHLHGLSPAQVREFVEVTTGVVPNDRLVRELYGATDGNILFLGEIARELRGSDAIADSESGGKLAAQIPHSIRSAIRAKLRQLPDSIRDFLLSAAVAGSRFDFRLVTEVSGANPAQAANAVKEGTRHGLLRPADSALGLYRFSHDLVAEVIYEEIPSDVRQALHCRIAEHLERLHPGDVPAGNSQIVHHYLRALPAASDRVVIYARKAAEDSTRLFAYSEAARLYELTLHALEQIEPADPLQRCEILLALGEAQCRAGDYDRFRQTFLDAARTARLMKSAEHLARAALGYGMLGNALSPKLTDSDPITKGLIDEALTSLASSDHPLRARLLARMAEEVATTASPGRLASLIDEAIAIARVRGDAEAQANALYIKFRAIIRGPDRPAESKALLDEILEIAERSHMEHWGSRIHYHLGEVALDTGNVAGVHRCVAMLNAIPEALHHASAGKIDSEITLVVKAMCSLIEGRFEDAEQASGEALALGLRRKHPESLAFYGLQMVEVRREQGRIAEIIEPTVSNLVADPQNALVRAILAFAYAQTGRLREARVEFSRLAANEFRSFLRDFTWLGTMAYVVEACVALGDPINAAILARLLTPMAQRNVALGFFCYLGPVAYYLGSLAAILNQYDEAVLHLSVAIDSAQKMGATGWVARIQLRMARTLLARGSEGDLDLARTLIEESRNISDGLRSKDLLDIVAEVSSRLPATRETSDEKAETHSNVFHREGDYWTISFAGKTVRIHQSKGLVYISELLANPNQEIHVLKLEALAHGADPSIPLDNQLIEAESDAGEVLDRQAKSEYRARWKEISQELEEARELNDLGRIEKLNSELGSLGQQLARATGLGGRDRRVASNVERARVRIRNTISSALVRLGESHPSLADHFATSLRTGVFCSYQPESAQSVRWVR